MKKIVTDFRKGVVEVRIETLDDLWYLKEILEEGDQVSGVTFRKIKLSSDTEKSKTDKKKVYLKISLEKIEFSETDSSLRLLGIITGGPEDIPRGEHHTIALEEGSQIKIFKNRWLSFQIERLKESFNSEISSILLVVFDREEAFFARLKKYGYEMVSHIEGNVQKKREDQVKKTNFYSEIIAVVKDQVSRQHFDTVVMGSPAFFKEELVKNLNDPELKKKIVLATCSSVSKSGMDELLKREELKSVLARDRTTREILLVEDLMSAIAKGNKAGYGLVEVERAVEMGAAKNLLVTDKKIQQMRSEGDFERLEKLLLAADAIKSEVHIISSRNSGGEKLDGLGGVGTILRFKI